jgi:tRNA(fMet)-specific endonuclease VapC
MSLRVLDTDILTLLQERDPVVVARVASFRPDDLAITVISVEEQLSGWYRRLRRAQKPAELAKVYQRLTTTVTSLSRLPILSFTEPAIDRYQQLKALKSTFARWTCASLRSRWNIRQSSRHATLGTFAAFRMWPLRTGRSDPLFRTSHGPSAAEEPFST